jgi:hypothetical protein
MIDRNPIRRLENREWVKKQSLRDSRSQLYQKRREGFAAESYSCS